MTGPPLGPTSAAGWFPDPSSPGQLRYYDGSAWTAATHLPPVQAAAWYPEPLQVGWMRWWDGANWVGQPQPQPYAQSGGSAPYASFAPYPYGAPEPKGPILRTASGDWFELAGWWRRAGGLLLDWLIVGVPFGIVNFVVLVFAGRSGNGGMLFGVNGVTGETEWLVLLRVLLVIAPTAAAFAYAVWLIGSRRQTWGMQAVGITAIDPSGRQLTRRQVWMRALYRVLFISLWSNLLSVAVILDHHRHVGLSAATSFVTLAPQAVVYLWVLGSERNQTLIDRAVGSVVVRGKRLGLAAQVADPPVTSSTATPWPPTMAQTPTPPPSTPPPPMQPPAPPFPGA